MRGALQKAVREVRIRERSNCEILWRMCRASKRNGRPARLLGFALTHHETSVKDFYDQEELKRIYYPEIERLLREATGPENILVFDHRVRNLTLAQRGEKNAQGYAKLVHNDYSAKSGPRRVRDHLPAAEAEYRLRSRFAEINVWRPIRGPVESTPLALCDARSIDAQDFMPVDLVYPDKVGESYYFTYMHPTFIFQKKTDR
jgi:hypothetical protein